VSPWFRCRFSPRRGYRRTVPFAYVTNSGWMFGSNFRFMIDTASNHVVALSMEVFSSGRRVHHKPTIGVLPTWRFNNSQQRPPSLTRAPHCYCYDRPGNGPYAPCYHADGAFALCDEPKLQRRLVAQYRRETLWWPQCQYGSDPVAVAIHAERVVRLRDKSVFK